MRELDACGIGFVADAQRRSTRRIVTAALGGLANVKHRGAVAADARTSDGCGLLTTIPSAVYGEGNGVAMLFVRGDDATDAVEAAAQAEDLDVVEWRTPVTDTSALGELAVGTQPRIVQLLFRPNPTLLRELDRIEQTGAGLAVDARAALDLVGDELERRTYRMRRRVEATAPGTYVVSCSFRTIVHKGLAAADSLADFYRDLADDRFDAHLAIFHQRFSTNTLPTWERAQPFRMLCHNGEINTIEGNENRMRARGRLGTVKAGLGVEELFRPVLGTEGSDSGRLDEAAELLLRGGRSLAHTMAMLVPEAWEETRDLDPEVRGFYEYHSALMEPWDGPAGVIFTDGVRVGATLDRNGLRPLRYAISDDGTVVCASEMGAVDMTGRGMVDRARLGPGHMLLVGLDGGLVRNQKIKERLSELAPYAQWAADGFVEVGPGEPVDETPDDLLQRQAAHGYTKEELAMVLKPMATDAYEPTFAMGDDSPLPPMAGRARPVAHFLRQRFAQVTNPPIDPLRERLVMSLRTLLGPRAPVLSEGPDAARLIALESFFVYPSAVAALEAPGGSPFPVEVLPASFDPSDGPAGLREAVGTIARRAEAAVDSGVGVLVIDPGAPAPDRVPIPSVLAVGAAHQRLIATRRRSDTSIVVVADDVRDSHSVAVLLGFGADAVCPRLALQTVAAETDEADTGDLVSSDAQERYRAAIETGVLKILSKMGVSTVDSYRGAQLFEVIGLADEVVDLCFTRTSNPVGGIGWDALGQDALDLHAAAFPAESAPELQSPGFYRVRKGGEHHANSKEVTQAHNELTLVLETPKLSERNPQAVDQATAHLLQRAIASGQDDHYEAFVKLVTGRPPTELNDLLEWTPVGEPVPIEEVEPASEIARRFSTGAMSHGSLSREAHETLAQAMNLIGGRSNCGEGGEDPYRFHTRGLGREDKNSRIKQVASGRFGVTPEYLAHADELQIKMAQGSKPGEGGQLPGHKVSSEIARLRHTQPGVGLISPPPHHDIYSIEDLAQLIYDLKQVNAALVSVKLVATENVGTIAAGVVKALADVVHISGGNGGTGASPLSSIKHAGMPWEIGLADAQRALVDNGLRGRVRLRVDGGFKTGRHVVLAALLGADEYSFGTAAMIAEGCIMLRACHRDTCKPGIATQRPHLRANFAGTPEGVAAYFMFVAHEVRRHLASMGARSLDELVGRVELLRQRRTGDDRVDAFDLTFLVEPPEHDDDEPRHFVERVELQDPRSTLGDQLLADGFRDIWDGDLVELAYPITNADRSIGAALSGALALEFGAETPRGSARVRFDGSAGQSFGAFLGAGVEMELVGEANDYVGKGMGGGRITIRPPADDKTVAEGTGRGSSTVLAGNTCLYGATGGELFVAGAVGERFAVRNSGAVAVVEAVGDHCCEYMTGGTIVVLGRIGYNLGAGMTGGQAFVWDPLVERVLTRVNPDLVAVLRAEHDDLDELRWLVERHVELTSSPRGRLVLSEWDELAEQLWHVVPRTRAETLVATAARRVGTA